MKQVGPYFFTPDKRDKNEYLGGIGTTFDVFKGSHKKTKKEVAIKIQAK